MVDQQVGMRLYYPDTIYDAKDNTCFSSTGDCTNPQSDPTATGGSVSQMQGVFDYLTVAGSGSELLSKKPLLKPKTKH